MSRAESFIPLAHAHLLHSEFCRNVVSGSRTELLSNSRSVATRCSNRRIHQARRDFYFIVERQHGNEKTGLCGQESRRAPTRCRQAKCSAQGDKVTGPRRQENGTPGPQDSPKSRA